MIPRSGPGGWHLQIVLRRAAVLAAALVLAQAAQPAGAQSQGGISYSATSGFDGYFKERRWIPVQLRLGNDGPDAEVLVEILPRPAPAGRAIEYSQTVSLAAGARKSETLYVYPTGATRSLHIRLSVDGQLIAETGLPLTALTGNDLLVGVMAANPTPFNLIRTPSGRAGASRVEIAWLAAEALPDRGPALSGLDAIVIQDLDTGVLTTAQRQALADWVASGGRLLICGGPGWQRTTAGLTELLPIQITGTQLVNSLGSVGAYLGGLPGPQGETILAVGRPAADAAVLIEQAGLPVALSRRLGLGQVTFLAADPTLAPLEDWSAVQFLYRALLLEGPYPPSASWGLRESSAADAASLFPNLTLPPIGAVCGFLLLYTFALGPLHYILLRKATRRELAWITIPALVVVFSGAAFGIGSATRGSRPVLNRLSVVRVAKGAQRAQVTGVLGIFSPSRRALEVEFPPGLLARPLSGEYSLTDGDWQYHRTAAGPGVSRLQFDAASVRGLVFEGDIASPRSSHSLTAEVVGNVFRLEGQVTSHDLRLQDAALLTPYGAIALGDLDPGQPREIRESLVRGSGPRGVLGEALSALGATYTTYPRASTEIDPVRRESLLEAIMLSVDGLTQSGTYLAGWSETAALPVELASASKAEDLTLYLFELGTQPGPVVAPAIVLPQVTVSPTMPLGLLRLQTTDFEWHLTYADPAGSSPSPFGAQLTQGSYSLFFIPFRGVSYRSVQALTLHLEGFSSGAEPEEFIALYDFQRGDWGAIPGLGWGDNPIPFAERYVGPAGQVRLRVENTRAGVVIDLTRSEFSMVIEP